jgi:cytochrome c2
VGRRAGSVAGYPYSAALRASGVQWTPSHLETWLAGPQDMVPGTLMPMNVPGVQARRDIVAYLETIKAGS